jgi:hypothetical protein
MQLKIVFEKTSKQKKIQENGKYHKCSFSQSHTSQNQHKKPTRSSEEEAEYQILNLGVCLK